MTMLHLLMLAVFSLLMYGVHALASWGVHAFGPFRFGIVAFPLIFLAAYLFDRRWGGGASFW
jgi:hypothetical protein